MCYTALFVGNLLNYLQPKRDSGFEKVKQVAFALQTDFQMDFGFESPILIYRKLAVNPSMEAPQPLPCG